MDNRLTAPEGLMKGTVSADGQVFTIVDGVVTVPDHVARTLIESHGYKVYADEDGEDPHEGLAPQDRIQGAELMLGLIDKMDRPQLLTQLEQAGIAFVPPKNNKQLKAMLREAAEAEIAKSKKARGQDDAAREAQRLADEQQAKDDAETQKQADLKKQAEAQKALDDQKKADDIAAANLESAKRGDEGKSSDAPKE